MEMSHRHLPTPSFSLPVLPPLFRTKAFPNLAPQKKNYCRRHRWLGGLRELGLATFDENRRSAGMLNPMRDTNEGTYRGGETRPVTPACPEGRCGKNLLRV